MWYYVYIELTRTQGAFIMFNVQMVGNPIPGLPHNFNVDCDTKSEMEDIISDAAGVDVTILFIDILDMNGRDHDTAISVDGSYHSHKANVTRTIML